MTRFNMRSVRLASVMVALSVAGAAREGSAQVTFGFEPPTYTAGPLVGQDGWIKNTYYGPMNGTVNVSSSSPITGAQSIAYTQTTAGGFSDVGRFGAILAPAIQGTDLSVSYVIEATTGVEGPNAGLFLGNGAPGGASPILARINGGVIEFGSAGGFIPMNSFFFLEGERIKMTYELDFNVGSMNLILENLSFPGAPVSQSGPFFAPYGAPTGANGEYVVDMGIFFRGGNVKVDDIAFTLGVGALDLEFEWASAGSGNFNQTTNWTPNGVPGTLPGRQKVTFGSAITSTQTVYNNAARNLNSLEFDNANSYILAGTGSLAFQSDTSGPTTVDPTIIVGSGAHQIQLAVELIDDTSVTVSPGASLAFNNQINLNGNTLTTSGTVLINHSTIGGGTVNSTGALVANGASSIGGNLVSSGALLIGVDEEGADSLAVQGDAIFSGILDVKWNASKMPTTPMTIVSTGGSLDATGLSLAAEDARSFLLAADGSNLTLTFLGAAVPEPASAALLAIGVGLVAVRRRRLLKPLAMLAAVLVAVGPAVPTFAVVYNFENPPYTPGNLIGQQGWITPGYVLADPFFGGTVNGTVQVSASSPLVGSQSALYTQTSVPSGAGATGASDASRPYAVFAVKDGTTAVDLTASFQIRTNNNGVGNGSAGFFLGRGGASPILVLITDANSTNGTGGILVGDNAALPNVGAYAANSIYEFTIGVDVDNANYEVFSRNVTAGTPATQLIGSQPGGRFKYLGGGFVSDGDDLTYTFDTTMIMRSGEARFDSVTAVGDDFTEARWVGGSGNWATNAGWIPNMVPNVTADNAPIAVFGSGATTPQTVFTNTTQTVNGLRFDNANKYAIAGGGAVALKANTIGGTVNPTINVVSGSHELQAPVSILNNAAVTVASGGKLDFNNSIALGGRTLTTSGAVDINFGVTGGGTISNSGTLGTAGATPIAANLLSTGTLQIDLGAANTDRFNITGSATLSGLLDVVLEPGFTPAGSYTVLTSTGALNAASLALHPSDTSSFTLGVSGNSLILTVGGGPSTPGDFNNDGFVNGADLTKWRGDFGVNGNSDADGDSDSDGNDFLIWQRNVQGTPTVATSGSVPEPTAVMLASMAVLGGAAVGRRRRV